MSKKFSTVDSPVALLVLSCIPISAALVLACSKVASGLSLTYFISSCPLAHVPTICATPIDPFPEDKAISEVI